jgi:hypothetical protein
MDAGDGREVMQFLLDAIEPVLVEGGHSLMLVLYNLGRAQTSRASFQVSLERELIQCSKVSWAQTRKMAEILPGEL